MVFRFCPRVSSSGFSLSPCLHVAPHRLMRFHRCVSVFAPGQSSQLTVFVCVSEAAGPSEGCPDAAAACLQRDVLRGGSLLDVPHPDPAVCAGRSDLPGLAAGLHPWGRGGAAGLHGWLLRHPAALHLHLHHVPRGGDAAAGRMTSDLCSLEFCCVPLKSFIRTLSIKPHQSRVGAETITDVFNMIEYDTQTCAAGERLYVSHTHTQTHTRSHSHSLTHTHTHTHTQTDRHTYMRTHTLTQRHSHTLTHTQRHTHTHTQCHQSAVFSWWRWWWCNPNSADLCIKERDSGKLISSVFPEVLQINLCHISVTEADKQQNNTFNKSFCRFHRGKKASWSMVK